MATIRPAELKDVPSIFQMINNYAAEQIMLTRSLPELYECVREFLVAEENGAVVGCGALKLYSADLAEIRSLCVDQTSKSRGLGRALIGRLLEEADRLRLKTVFALTVVPAFFTKLGFREGARERFPSKIWRDCLHCSRYFHCNEKTVVYELVPQPETEPEPAREQGEVPA